MIVKIDRSFEKDVKKINSESINRKIEKLILEIRQAESISKISNLKKISGTKNYYRIRLGEFRIGITVLKGEIQLIRILHRKDIYRYFP